MTKWTELARGKVEARVPCPHCQALNYFDGHLNPYWLAANAMVQQTQCQSCKKFFGVKFSKDGAVAG